MAVRTRDWLKFGALVALAFVFGLAFASTLGLPKKGVAAESIVATQPVAPPVQIAVAKSVADLSNGFVSVAEHVKPAGVFIKAPHLERPDNPRLPPRVQDLFSPGPRARR